MLKASKGFNGFSVNDLAAAKKFYGETLWIEIDENPQGVVLNIAGGNGTFVYPKDDHVPATFTILSFPVSGIDQAIEDLRSKGITFEQYAGFTDDKRIARGLSNDQGPDIAWFKDPAGNILSVLDNG
jgi:hypothetical protein